MNDFVHGARYLVEVHNQSKAAIAPVLYWTMPSDSAGTLQPVAWAASAAAPTTILRWDFVYIEAFLCWPGQAPSAGSIVSKPLLSPVAYPFNNEVTLSYAKKNFSFGTPHPNGPTTNLQLIEDTSVPTGATVGLAVDGTAAVVTSSQPATRLTFSALQLNLGFGNVPQASVLNLADITGSKPVKFPENVNTLYAMVGTDGGVTFTQYPPATARVTGAEQV